MQFVRNSYYYNEIPEPTDQEGILKHIEKIGRLCYRSDDLIEDDSAAAFIGRLKDRKHLAMLEHYIFTLSIPKKIYDMIVDPVWTQWRNIEYGQKMKYVNVSPQPDLEVSYDKPDYQPNYLISGSATAFNYLWACHCVKMGWNEGMEQICKFLRHHHPDLMIDPRQRPFDPKEKDFDPDIRFLTRKEVKALPTELRKIHDWMSVHFVVERSSTHDLVRHRNLVSYAQESTRWCNYDKKGLCFIIPCQFDERTKSILEDSQCVENMMKSDENVYDIDPAAYWWFYATTESAMHYQKLLNEYHMTPQEAKAVLPQCLRAEINITTFMGEWKHIFSLRASKNAYPQIQEVMIPLLKDQIDRGDTIFNVDAMTHLVEEGSRFVRT